MDKIPSVKLGKNKRSNLTRTLLFSSMVKPKRIVTFEFKTSLFLKASSIFMFFYFV